jgi:hypothetical protein
MKAINNEQREAQVGKYLRPENFTGKTWNMYLIYIRQETKESARTGKAYTQNVYGFIDDKGEERILSGFLDDALWHAMEKADPEMGQLMDISAEEVAQNVYVWTIDLKKEVMDIGDSAVGAQDQAEADGGLTEAQRAGKQVLEDGAKTPKEEEITLEDLPEIFQ